MEYFKIGCEKNAEHQLLGFGTSGVRGIMGSGLGRINVFTVYKYALAFARELASKGGRKALLCRDCRHGGESFLDAACSAMVRGGIEPYVIGGGFAPSPMLSFAVRYCGFDGGINITSSHNTKEYNGLKMYGPDGALITDEYAEGIQRRAEENDIPQSVPAASGVKELSANVEEEYIKSISMPRRGVKAVFTPLHGVSGRLFMRASSACGFDVIPVFEQMEPDGDFPTVASPNPESLLSMDMACARAREVGAGLVIALDPDGDRMGAMEAHEGVFSQINPNRMAALLLDQLLWEKGGDDISKMALITTYVSGGLASALAEKRGMRVYITPTGFKNMARKRAELQKEGITVILAFEEAFGYMTGRVWDKDGISAGMTAIAAAGRWAQKGKSLREGAISLMEEAGFFDERWHSFPTGDISAAEVFKRVALGISKVPGPPGYGADGFELMEIQSTVRVDFNRGRLWIRPSGTEPKLKLYSHGMGHTLSEAADAAERIMDAGVRIINEYMGDHI
ncbi:MAG: hypothetical protein VB078_04190 [Clostridiaceae bacterium]|nr:hypothetical protein [Clostridiaceae bacterium]